MNYRKIEMTSAFCKATMDAGVLNAAAFDVLRRAQSAGWVEDDDRRISGRIVNERFIPDDFGAWLLRLSVEDGAHLFRPPATTTIQ